MLQFENQGGQVNPPRPSSQIDASRLTAPRPAAAALPFTEPASPAAPTNAADPAKGGKGGKEASPSLPSTNGAFLAAVVQDVADGAHPLICSKSGDPANGGWEAQVAIDVDGQCPPDRNNYFNSSSFLTDGNQVRAVKDQVGAYHVLVLDDVGSKVDRSLLDDFVPTYEIETSPGNSQFGIRLKEPLRDLAEVGQLQNAIIEAGLSDNGAGGAARWARLPFAINGKAKHLDGDRKPFSCRLVQWHPDTAYTVAELMTALGLSFDGATAEPPMMGITRPMAAVKPRGNEVFTPAPIENPVLSALRERDLYKSKLAPGKHDVTCPWVGQHTDELDTGAAYFEPSTEYPTGGFRCQHSHGDDYHIGELVKFLGVEPAQARGKASINMVPGELNAIRRAAEEALAAKGGYYQMGGAIVTIRRDPSSGEISTELLTDAPLAAALADAADWYRFDSGTKNQVRSDPQAKYVQTLLKAPEYAFLPVLKGLARQPFFREGDCHLISEPGYDAVSGRYASFDADKFLMGQPTRETAVAALAEMEELLDEFQFATPADRSAALCAMLTGSVRPSLAVAPAFNITASTPGSGKSYLAATILPFAGPGHAAKVSYPRSDDEATKTMLSLFIAAPAAILFDDMQTDWIPHGAINRALTSETVTDRVLGISRTVTVGTRSLIMGTGNNIGPVRDMSRRVVTIRLNNRTANPALQSYVGNPEATVKSDRERYVSLALTIIAAWKAAGSPKADVPSIASYGAWSDMCRQPLLWLGLPDPATSLIEQVQHDPDQDALGELLKAWHAAVGEKDITLRDLMDNGLEQEHLRDAIEDLPVMDRGDINRSKFGWYLKKHANRIASGFELQRGDSSSRNAWRVVAIDDATA